MKLIKRYREPSTPITSSMGYVPNGVDVAKTKSKIIRDFKNRLYKKINPFNSYSYLSNIGQFLFGDDINYSQEELDENNVEDQSVADALFAQYLEIPEKQRRSMPRGIRESKYKPTIGARQNKYYALDLPESAKQDVIARGLIVPINKSQESAVLASKDLGSHGISHGFDKNGEYVSYHDTWDLNPFSGKYGSLYIPGLGDKDNINLFGKPVDIYDRIYLDQFYNTPKDQVGTGKWLQEVTVTPYWSDTNGWSEGDGLSFIGGEAGQLSNNLSLIQ